MGTKLVSGGKIGIGKRGRAKILSPNPLPFCLLLFLTNKKFQAERNIFIINKTYKFFFLQEWIALDNIIYRLKLY